MKKILSFILAVAVIAVSLGIQLPHAFAKGAYILSPTAFDQIDGTLSCEINVPDEAFGTELYLDGELLRDLGGQTGRVSCAEDLSEMPGRHILGVKIRTAAGYVSQELPITVTDDDMPYIVSVSYASGGSQIPDTDWKYGTRPLATCDGYRLTFSGAYDASDMSAEYGFVKNGRYVPASAEVTADGTDICVKPEGIAPAGVVNIIEIKNPAYGTKPIRFAFIPERLDCAVSGAYFFEDSCGMIPHIGGESSDDVFIRREEETGNGFLRFYKTKNIGAYADTDTLTALPDKYVIDFKIKLNTLDEGEEVDLLDGRDRDGKWQKGLTLTRSRNRYSIKQYGYDKELTTLSANGRWARLSLVVDAKTGTYDFFKNAVAARAVKNVPIYNPKTPQVYRIDMLAGSGGTVDFAIDDFVIYSGDELRSDITSYTYVSGGKLDEEASARYFIADAGVYSTVSDNYIADGILGRYPAGARAKSADGEAWVNSCFIREVFGASGDLSVYAAEDMSELDGETFVRARTVADAAGLCFFWDERGFFIFSDTEFVYRNSEAVDNCFDAADFVYRYAVFDNPRAEEIIADAADTDVHPRVLYTRDEIEYIKERSKTDPEMFTSVQNAVQSARNHLGWAIIQPDDSSAVKSDHAARGQQHIINFAQAYLLTGEESFAEAGVALMNNAAKWSDLSPDTSNLIIGHWAMVMAVGYDSFYDYLSATSEGRAKLTVYRDAVKRLVFDDTLAAYRGEVNRKWINIADNFSGVIGGGVGTLALLFLGDDEFGASAADILENIVKTNEITVGLLGSDGGYFEGVSYANYMLENMCSELELLWKMCGTDYALSAAEGLQNAGAFLGYMQTPSGNIGYSDTDTTVVKSSVPAYLAYRYGKIPAAAAYRVTSKECGYIDDLSTLYYYDRAVDIYGAPDLGDIQEDSYFDSVKSGMLRDSFNTAAPTVAGFHADRNGLAHDHIDAGTFTFEAEGVKWAYDLGSDSYGISDYFGKTGYRLYRKNAEGHNVVVINPTEYSAGKENYYGQKTDGKAHLVEYKSVPKGAYAMFDMTDVYERDVTSYMRGFYFGDGRTSFVVQDEIELLGTSELYWYMHSAADEIEIADGGIILKSGNRRLAAKIYCNVPYEIEVLEPVSIFASKESGQAENEGKKLALHLQNVSDRVEICVKLMPEGGSFEYLPMSQWTLPSGELCEAARISDAKINAGSITARLSLPKDTAGAELLADGFHIADIEPIGGQIYYTAPVTAALSKGVHTLTLAAELTGGRRQTDDTVLAVGDDDCETLYENSELNFKYYNSRIGYYDYDKIKGIKPYISGSGYEAENGAKCFTSDGSTDAKAGVYFAGGDSEDFYAYDMDFVLENAEGDMGYEFAAENAGYRKYTLPLLYIVQNGRFVDGSAVEAGRRYNVRLMLDVKNRTYAVLLDGKTLIGCTYNARIKAPEGFALFYRSIGRGNKVTYSNMHISAGMQTDANIGIVITKIGNKAIAEYGISDCRKYSGRELMATVAVYDVSGRLLAAGTTGYEIVGDGVHFDVETKLPEEAHSIKAILTDGMTPLCECAEVIPGSR